MLNAYQSGMPQPATTNAAAAYANKVSKTFDWHDMKTEQAAARKIQASLVDAIPLPYLPFFYTSKGCITNNAATKHNVTGFAGIGMQDIPQIKETAPFPIVVSGRTQILNTGASPILQGETVYVVRDESITSRSELYCTYYRNTADPSVRPALVFSARSSASIRDLLDTAIHVRVLHFIQNKSLAELRTELRNINETTPIIDRAAISIALANAEIHEAYQAIVLGGTALGGSTSQNFGPAVLANKWRVSLERIRIEANRVYNDLVYPIGVASMNQQPGMMVSVDLNYSPRRL